MASTAASTSPVQSGWSRPSSGRKHRAGDMPRQVAPRFRVDPRVLHPVQHQRRHPDRRQDAAHVDRGVHPHQRRRRRRRAGEPLEPRPPGGEVRVRDAPGGERRERRPGAPAPLGLGGEAFGRLGGQHPAVEVGIAAVEHQRPGPLRAGGGEQQRHRRPLARPEDRRPAAAGGVHHRAHVVHPGLEVGQMRRVHPVARARCRACRSGSAARTPTAAAAAGRSPGPPSAPRGSTGTPARTPGRARPARSPDRRSGSRRSGRSVSQAASRPGSPRREPSTSRPRPSAVPGSAEQGDRSKGRRRVNPRTPASDPVVFL